MLNLAIVRVSRIAFKRFNNTSIKLPVANPIIVHTGELKGIKRLLKSIRGFKYMDNLISIQNKEGQLLVSSREIAKNFEKNHRDVLESIDVLISGVAGKSADLFIVTEYRHEQNKQVYRKYLLTRDGFSLLVMGFTGKKALEWKLKYIEAFNKMEQALKEQNNLSNLSPELQVLINLEKKQTELQTAVTENKQEIQDMRNVIRLDTSSWRKESADLINKMAIKAGGFEHISLVRQEIYDLVNSRMGVSLEIRLVNKRRRMAEDKKLIEGYIAIVKEMAIKNKVA